MEYESVWNGKSSLTESLDRDYAAMRGDGWEPVWEPTSPLTTPWEQYPQWHTLDPDRFVRTRFERARRLAKREAHLVKDWQGQYHGSISQGGRGWR